MTSNLPPGGGFYGGVQAVEHICPKCGLKWDAPMYFELGGWFYADGDDEQGYCPVCGAEGDLD